MAKVYGGGEAPGDRVFLPVERVDLPRVRRRPEARAALDRRTRSRCSRSALVSVLVLYAASSASRARCRSTRRTSAAVPPALSFNTAVSFLTNTNWQNYAGESTMSHLTQMAGLAVQNFVSAARRHRRRGRADPRARAPAHATRSATSGSTSTRTTTRILLPLAFVFALVLVSQGVDPELPRRHDGRRRSTGTTQTIPGGPIASQEAIKELGENGGGPFNANSAHPFENPNADHEHPRDLAAARHPVRAHLHVRQDGRGPEAGLGGASPRWSCSGSRRALIAMPFETRRQPEARPRRRRPDGRPPTSRGGNMEGKEVRFGPAACGLFAASTTGTSTGVGQLRCTTASRRSAARCRSST